MSAAFWSHSMLTVVLALFRFLSTLFGVVSVAPVTIGIILVFTFQSLLRSGCQILAFMHAVLVLLYSRVSRHCDIYQQCCLVVLYVCSICSSVFSHMICLDTYIAVDFDLLRLYHWFSRMSVPLFRTRQAILLIQSAVDSCGNFVMSLLILQLCQLSLLHSLIKCATVSALCISRRLPVCLFSLWWR